MLRHPVHPLVSLLAVGIPILAFPVCLDSRPAESVDAPVFRPTVVNGTEAPDLPWAVSLLQGVDGTQVDRFTCGGVLVGPNWVLTAGHCVDDVDPASVRIGVGPRLGEQVEYAVRDIIPHWAYEGALDSGPDLALIWLENPGNDPLVSLPLVRDPAGPTPGTPVTIVGWGATSFPGGALSSVLLTAEMTLGDRDLINDRLAARGDRDRVPPDIVALVPTPDLASPCNGDSGGAYLVRDPRTGKWRLLAVTNRGIGGPCGSADVVALGARVSRYLEWIDHHVHGDFGRWAWNHDDAGRALIVTSSTRRREYLFGGPPPAGLPWPEGARLRGGIGPNGRFQLFHTERPSRNGSIYTYEWSPDFRTWYPIAAVSEIFGQPTDRWTVWRGIDFAIPAGQESSRYFRVSTHDAGESRQPVLRLGPGSATTITLDSRFTPDPAESAASGYVEFYVNGIPAGSNYAVSVESDRAFLRRYDAAGNAVVTLQSPTRYIVDRITGGGEAPISYRLYFTPNGTSDRVRYTIHCHPVDYPVTGTLPASGAGTLDSGDFALPDGRRMVAYRIPGGSSGDLTRVRIGSGEFDTLLRVVDAATGRPLHFDDNIRGFREDFILPAPERDAHLLVSSFEPGETGAFTITSEPVEPSDNTTVSFGVPYFGVMAPDRKIERTDGPHWQRSHVYIPPSTDTRVMLFQLRVFGPQGTLTVSGNRGIETARNRGYDLAQIIYEVADGALVTLNVSAPARYGPIAYRLNASLGSLDGSGGAGF